MRERLIELLESGVEEAEMASSPLAESIGIDVGVFADYLLEHGVVILPCKCNKRSHSAQALIDAELTE